MRTDTEQQTKMHTKSTNVRSGLTADPEYTQLPLIVELVNLALVNGSDTELSLDSRDKRWALEEGSGECFEGASELGLATRKLVVQTDDTNILLSGSLLRLHETSRAVDADNKTASDLRVKSSAVASLLHPTLVLTEIQRGVRFQGTQVP